MILCAALNSVLETLTDRKFLNHNPFLIAQLLVHLLMVVGFYTG